MLSPALRKRYAKAVKMPLGSWLLDHPLPAIVEGKYDGKRGFLYYSRGKMLWTTKTYKTVFTKVGQPALFADLPSQFSAQTLILDTEAYPRKHPDHIGVFDVLEKDGQDLTGKTLGSRKAVLADLFTPTEHFHQVPYETVDSAEAIQTSKERMVAKGWEGIVVKDLLSRYYDIGGWRKDKKKDTLDAVILYPDPENDTFKQTGIAHSWFVGLYDERGELVGFGKVGTYYETVDPALIRKNTVVEIAYQELTAERKLRDPRIVDIRDDKLPIECTTEQLEADQD